MMCDCVEVYGVISPTIRPHLTFAHKTIYKKMRDEIVAFRRARPGFVDRLIHGAYFSENKTTVACEKSFRKLPMSEVFSQGCYKVELHGKLETGRGAFGKSRFGKNRM